LYEQYWKFQSNLFGDESNPDFYFRSRTHHAALLKMRYLVENNKGAGLLVGGTGCGKTYLVNLLPHVLLDHSGPVIY